MMTDIKTCMNGLRTWVVFSPKRNAFLSNYKLGTQFTGNSIADLFHPEPHYAFRFSDRAAVDSNIDYVRQLGLTDTLEVIEYEGNAFIRSITYTPTPTPRAHV